MCSRFPVAFSRIIAEIPIFVPSFVWTVVLISDRFLQALPFLIGFNPDTKRWQHLLVPLGYYY